MIPTTMIERKFLILDDDPARHLLFQIGLAGTSITLTHCSTDCIEKLLSEESWSGVFLDHDLELAEAYFNSLKPGNGMDVVRALEDNQKAVERLQKNKTLIIVHSLNPGRAPNMVWRLERLGLQTCRRSMAYEDRDDLIQLAETGEWDIRAERWNCISVIREPAAHYHPNHRARLARLGEETTQLLFEDPE